MALTKKTLSPKFSSIYLYNSSSLKSVSNSATSNFFFEFFSFFLFWNFITVSIKRLNFFKMFKKCQCKFWLTVSSA